MTFINAHSHPNEAPCAYGAFLASAVRRLGGRLFGDPMASQFSSRSGIAQPIAGHVR